MTHPLVSAFHRASQLPKSCLGKDAVELLKLDDLVHEVVASIHIPKLFVGFYTSHFGVAISIWRNPNLSDDDREVILCTHRLNH